MRFSEHRVFERQYKKLSNELQERVGERLALLIADERNPLLNNHKLNPLFERYRSVNITGDYRLIYKKLAPDVYFLRAVGAHHQLFGS